MCFDLIHTLQYPIEKANVHPDIVNHHHHSGEKGSSLQSRNLKVVIAEAVMKQMRGGSNRMY